MKKVRTFVYDIHTNDTDEDEPNGGGEVVDWYKLRQTKDEITFINKELDELKKEEAVLKMHNVQHAKRIES